MSREIKFRVWDKDRKEFVYISETDEGFWINDGISTTVMPNHSSNLEQYTGLTDKNGVEIYEGDIIQTKYMNYIGWAVHDSACWVIRLSHENLFALDLAEEVGVGGIVIGNIHENPELLGEK